MKKTFLSGIACILLCACAPATMTDAYWQNRIVEQRNQIDISQRCCSVYSEVDYTSVYDNPVDLSFDSNNKVMNINGEISPVIGLKIEGKSSKYLEYVSLSDKVGGFGIRFDKVLYVRPEVIFLRNDFSEISRVSSPGLCWGYKEMRAGAWARFEIPQQASYIILVPSLKSPIQPIDTRRMGISTPEITKAISESRKSYHADIRMGYHGLINVEFLKEDRRPLGPCR